MRVKPSPKTQKRRTLVKLLTNTMYQHEDGATFDELAESIADVIIQTIFFEADNSDLFWDHFYSLQKKNKDLTRKRTALVKKYRRLRTVHGRLQERLIRIYAACDAAGIPISEVVKNDA